MKSSYPGTIGADTTPSLLRPNNVLWNDYTNVPPPSTRTRGGSAAISSTVKNISHLLLLSQEEVGSIVGTSARTVSRWSTGEVEPQRSARDRLLELVYVGEHVSKVLEPESVNLWLFSPNELLAADTPAERIRKGDFRSVLALIEAPADGVVV